MTIKEFSRLCGCTTQTLRYYDRQNLLKPIRVDEYSGYRYYSEDQALVFVKIKNLQKAGFTIEEIRGLLDKDDTDIYYAFEDKIEKEIERIKEIRQIQKSYQNEIVDMMNKVETVKKLLKELVETYDPYKEFGLNQKSYKEVLSMFDLPQTP